MGLGTYKSSSLNKLPSNTPKRFTTKPMIISLEKLLKATAKEALITNRRSPSKTGGSETIAAARAVPIPSDRKVQINDFFASPISVPMKKLMAKISGR